MRRLALALCLLLLGGCSSCDEEKKGDGVVFDDFNNDPPDIFNPDERPDGGCGSGSGSGTSGSGATGSGGGSGGQPCDEAPPVDCRQVPCVNGQCVPGGEEGHVCRCDEGYAGALCNTCDEGFLAEGNRCVPDENNPCAPNPCGESFRTRCVAQGAQFECQCDDGTAEQSGVCVPTCDAAGDLCAAARRGIPHLVSANGHGAIGYNIAQRKVDLFLEHPYRNFDEGVVTRNLAFDTYLGLRTGGTGRWLNEVAPARASYLEQSGVVHLVRQVDGLEVHTYVYAPWEVERPAVVLIGRVVNRGTAAKSASIYTLHNYHLGRTTPEEPVYPDNTTERLQYQANTGAYLETGVGGAMMHMPLGTATHHGATPDNPFTLLTQGRDLTDVTDSGTGDNRVAGFQRDFELGPGEEGWFGVVSAFDAFQDTASLGDELSSVYAGVGAQEALAEALAGWEDWRAPQPAGLSPAEVLVWRQSEAVLRQGQVHEEFDRSRGAVLASMPPGQWNIAWVRDAAYAIVAMARMGHHDEARMGLEFMLEADAGLYQEGFVGVPYRISVTRYFGRGKEETDFNEDGPNIEFDGFGLFLWALHEYTDASGDTSLARSAWPVVRGEIAGALEALVDGGTGLIRADSSIWEVHWNGNEKRFTYTSLSAARGLCDAARLADRLGEGNDAARFARVAEGIAEALAQRSVDGAGVLAGSFEELQRGSGYLDLAAIEAFNWGVFDANGNVARATLDAFEANLRVASGRGFFRNDDGGEYDSQEWVFLDLRAASAMRRAGRGQQAERLHDWVTAQALANEGLIAELHDPTTSAYAGAIPMIGFGAGAWVLTTLDRVDPQAVGGICDR